MKNGCDVAPAPNGRYKTGRDGFRSVGHKVSQPPLRDRTDISSLSHGRKNSGKGQFPSNQHPGTSKADQSVINAAMSVRDGSGNLDGHRSEELFDDAHRSRSPRSPRTYKSPHYKPPVPGASRRLTFSEPPRKTPTTSRNSSSVTPVSHGRQQTALDGFYSVGQKVSQPPLRDRTGFGSSSRGRNTTGQGQSPSPVYLKENQPPNTNKANLPQARESNDHSSVCPESSTAKQAGNTQLENEPQACEQSVLATILSEVQKTNSRLESFEERLEKLEESVHTPSSSSSGAVSDKYKQTVPTRVRVRVSVLIVAILQL